MRRPHPPRRSTIISAVAVLVLALVATTAYTLVKLEVFAPSLSEQMAQVEQTEKAWWLGRTFDGLPVTHAETASGDRVDDLGYGACQRFGHRLDPFTSTRCGYPLWMQVRRRKYALSLDDIPRLLDGSCVRTTVRSAPVVVGQSGAVLYSGVLAIAVLGRPGQVGRALLRLRPTRGTAAFEPPTLGVEALANCVTRAHPFIPLPERFASLHRMPGLPLAWVGRWFEGGQLTGAGLTGKTAVLSYTSCGRASDLGSCRETISFSSERFDQQTIRAALSGATCRSFSSSGATGVAWARDLAGETGVGAFLFTGDTVISFANQIRLEKIPIATVEAVTRLVRPLPPARRFEAPTHDTRRLLAACAELELVR
ncbi:MAG: hypothetical protein EXQ81_04655 [Thermoleophilia bacterium]|nr:hypothetical protein [Thermoleophilia bacterium]